MMQGGNLIFMTSDLGRDYPNLVSSVIQRGQTVPSRIGETKEILNFRLELDDPAHCIVGRSGFSKDFMIEEIAQILAGVHDNERLRAITPKAAELITPATAYGPRVKDQLDFVARELSESPTSRRALVYVGRHDDLTSIGDETAGEMPCTCVWQFFIRNDQLHMSVYMRSWDLVWGLSYDVPSFVAVLLAVSAHLGVEYGTYTHTAGSGHVYDRHYRVNTWPLLNGNLAFELAPMIAGDLATTRQRAVEFLEVT